MRATFLENHFPFPFILAPPSFRAEMVWFVGSRKPVFLCEPVPAQQFHGVPDKRGGKGNSLFGQKIVDLFDREVFFALEEGFQDDIAIFEPVDVILPKQLFKLDLLLLVNRRHISSRIQRVEK